MKVYLSICALDFKDSVTHLSCALLQVYSWFARSSTVSGHWVGVSAFLLPSLFSFNLAAASPDIAQLYSCRKQGAGDVLVVK